MAFQKNHRKKWLKTALFLFKSGKKRPQKREFLVNFCTFLPPFLAQKSMPKKTLPFSDWYRTFFTVKSKIFPKTNHLITSIYTPSRIN